MSPINKDKKESQEEIRYFEEPLLKRGKQVGLVRGEFNLIDLPMIEQMQMGIITE